MKRNRIALAGLALLAAGTLALAGCASGGGTASSSEGGDAHRHHHDQRLRAGEPADPDQHQRGRWRQDPRLDLRGSRLLRRRRALRRTTWRSRSRSTTRSTCTVKLKEGQTFTDGEEVTADNFIEAWNYGALLSNAQLNQLLLRGHRGLQLRRGLRAHRPRGGRRLHLHDRRSTAGEPTSPLRLGYSAFFPLPESRSKTSRRSVQNPIGNGPYMLAGEDAWQHDEQIDLVENPDYDGWPRGPANGGLTIIFYATQDAAYADLLAGNVDVIDGIPPSALATFEDDLGDRAVNQAAADLPVVHDPGAASRTSRVKRASSVARRSRWRSTAKRSPTRSSTAPAPRRSDFTSPVIDGWSDSLEGAEVLDVQRRRGEEAVGRGRRHRAVGRHVPDRLQRRRRPPGLGRRGRELDQEHARHRGVGCPVRRLRRRCAPRSTTARSRRRSAPAGRPTTRVCTTSSARSTRPTPARTTATTRTPSSTSCSRRALATPTPTRRTRSSRQAQEILLKDLPAIPLWYSNVDRRLRRDGRQRARSAGTRFRCTTRSPRRVTSMIAREAVTSVTAARHVRRLALVHDHAHDRLADVASTLIASRDIRSGGSGCSATSSDDCCRSIPVFFGATLLIYFMVFAMPGDPIAGALRRSSRRTPQVIDAAAGAVPPRSAVHRPVLLLHGRHLPGRTGRDLLGSVRQRGPRSHASR